MYRRLMSIALVASAVSASTGASPVPQTKSRLPIVTVSSPPGTERGSFQVRPEPYGPGKRPVITVTLLNRHDVRDEKGIVISAFGFYGWMQGAAVHLRVFAMVPGPGAPNRYLADEPNARDLLVPRDFADVTIAVGRTLKIDAMKRLGMEPMEVRVENKPAG